MMVLIGISIKLDNDGIWRDFEITAEISGVSDAHRSLILDQLFLSARSKADALCAALTTKTTSQTGGA